MDIIDEARGPVLALPSVPEVDRLELVEGMTTYADEVATLKEVVACRGVDEADVAADVDTADGSSLPIISWTSCVCGHSNHIVPVNTA